MVMIGIDPHKRTHTAVAVDVGGHRREPAACSKARADTRVVVVG